MAHIKISHISSCLIYIQQTGTQDDAVISYNMYLKSNSGEIKVYMVQPELAKTYDNKVLEMRLKEVSKGIKRGNEEDEKKEEEVTVKPKRKVGRYKLKFVAFANISLHIYALIVSGIVK